MFLESPSQDDYDLENMLPAVDSLELGTDAAQLCVSMFLESPSQDDYDLENMLPAVDSLELGTDCAVNTTVKYESSLPAACSSNQWAREFFWRHPLESGCAVNSLTPADSSNQCRHPLELGNDGTELRMENENIFASLLDIADLGIAFDFQSSNSAIKLENSNWELTEKDVTRKLRHCMCKCIRANIHITRIQKTFRGHKARLICTQIRKAHAKIQTYKYKHVKPEEGMILEFKATEKCQLTSIGIIIRICVLRGILYTIELAYFLRYLGNTLIYLYERHLTNYLNLYREWRMPCMVRQRKDNCMVVE
jgi:hypothetical protein